MTVSAWLPHTHQSLLDEHRADLKDLGAWYDDAILAIAVNDDAPIRSLTELADHADTFDNRIVGVDPASGLNRITREEVIPTYELDGMTFEEMSTSDMFGELETVRQLRQAGVSPDDGAAGRHVAVTLWQPHWAYAEYEIRNLADPEGVFDSAAEQIHSVAREGFSEEFPVAAEWVGNFHLTTPQLANLTNLVHDHPEEPVAAVQVWLDDRPDWVDQLKAGELR